MAALAQFARTFPMWLDADGFPKTFRLFKAGVIEIGRQNALEQLRIGRAMRAGQATADDFDRWVEEKIMHAGMPLSPRE